MTRCEVSQAFARRQWAIREGCTASIPWINQLFYDAIVVFGERDNRETIKIWSLFPPTIPFLIANINPFALLKYLTTRKKYFKEILL